jgi:formylglycine-generating enzyme required for sulfatase activity
VGDVVIVSSLGTNKVIFQVYLLCKNRPQNESPIRRIPIIPLVNSTCLSYNQRNWDIFHFMRPLRVFLCHSSKDKTAVHELYQKLRAETWIDPWLDEEKLLPGQDWHEEIEKAVEGTDVVIVLLSKQSVSQEGYVQRELKLALDVADEKPENTIFIIPLRLDDCPAPRRLRGWHYVDYFPASRKPWVMERLLASLKVRAEALGIKSTVEEEPKKETTVPLQEEKEPEVKFTQQKPFTKLLDPSSLSSKETSKPKSDKQNNVRQRKAKPDFVLEFSRRLMGAGWILLFVILLVGFGLNYYFNNPLIRANTPSPTQTITPKLPAFTSLPFTETPIPTKTTIPTPTLGIGSTMTGQHGETLVYVPAGEFTMGSDNGNDNKPAHTVYLDTFWIDRTEVTNKQYKACVDAGTCEPPSDKSSFTHPSYYGNPEFDNYPVVYVSWDKANRYCEVWAGGDLPTEAQWEKAARGTKAFTYPWGNDAPNKDLLNFNQNIGDTTEVGKYPDGKSSYGAYDMAGNVWEWVNDYYQSDYYAVLGNSASNPVGPESGQYRVLRGGSWNNNGYSSRSDIRSSFGSSYINYNFGFRCARSAK